MIKKNKQFNKCIFLTKLLFYVLFSLLLTSCSLKAFIAKNKTVEYYHYYYLKGTKMRTKETITLFQDSSFNVTRESYNLGNIVLIKGNGCYKQRNRFLILTCYDRHNTKAINIEEIQDTTIDGSLFIVINAETGKPIKSCRFGINNTLFQTEDNNTLPETSEIQTNHLGICSYDDSTKIRSFYVRYDELEAYKNYVIENSEANVFKISMRPQKRDDYYYFSNRFFFILNRNTLINKEDGKYHCFKKSKFTTTPAGCCQHEW